ncbi:uncharacterized protein LOC141655301 [Silene latifolia]|uniref:uncharacterized protein LOC141655301 n=1 Tax=Silene latifolia TaxID=37657 RepID=UPI003D7803A9
MKVTEIATSSTYCVSMVYAFNDLNGRKSLWDQLAQFAATVHEPWLVCGDFNCVLSYAERLGGTTCDQEIDDFQNCVNFCGLTDAPPMGSFFTWNNKQEIESRRYSRLDRALINAEWSQSMPDVYAHFLPEGIFDHTPCLIKSKSQGMRSRKPFKYFNMWGKAPQYPTHLAEWWEYQTQGTKMYKLVSKLKNLKHHFRRYNREFFSDIENSAGIALKNLEYIQMQIASNPGDFFWMEKEQAASLEYKELLDASNLFFESKG